MCEGVEPPVPTYANWLLLLATVAVFWLLLIRPAKKQQAALAAVQKSIEPGNRVILSSGIFGTIKVVREDSVDLEISPGTVIEVARQAVLRQAPEPSTPTTED